LAKLVKINGTPRMVPRRVKVKFDAWR